MEENVKTVLDYINTSITGVFLSVDGKGISFSYDKEKKNYIMRNGTKSQEISLNELLVLLNRPELQGPVEEEAKRIEEETRRMKALKQKYFEEIDALDIPEEEKERLRAAVRQMVLPSSKSGMGNRVPVVDPKLEEMREEYFAHRETYDAQREALINAIAELDKQAKASPEKAEEIKKEIEAKWDELSTIPTAPYILSQHLRLNDSGAIQLVTALDGVSTYHNYQVMTIPEIAEYTKGKELRLDSELAKLSDDYTK